MQPRARLERSASASPVTKDLKGVRTTHRSSPSLAATSSSCYCPASAFAPARSMSVLRHHRNHSPQSGRSGNVAAHAAAPEVEAKPSNTSNGQQSLETGAAELATAGADMAAERVSSGRSATTRGGTPQTYAYAALFGVAMLWGSYTPALRYLFLSDEPPSAPLLNALQASLSALFLATSGLFASLGEKDVEVHPELSNPLGAEAAALATMDPTYGSIGPERRIPGNAIEHAAAEALNWRSDSIVAAGAELGLWMCLAFGLEVLGVQLISATKAAFLNQATVLITPLLVHLSGEHVKKNEWGACGLGLMGSILVALDGMAKGAAEGGMHGAVAADQENPLGYVWVLLSAVFFAMSTVRMGRYSTQFASLNLASASTFSLAALSLAWLASSIQGQPDGVEDTLHVLHTLFTNPTSLLILIWVGVGPGALAAFLQATGQQSVPPAQAQVIYATTPLFATGFAMVALEAQDEAMGAVAWLGAALMLGASLLASFGGGEEAA